VCEEIVVVVVVVVFKFEVVPPQLCPTMTDAPGGDKNDKKRKARRQVW